MSDNTDQPTPSYDTTPGSGSRQPVTWQQVGIGLLALALVGGAVWRVENRFTGIAKAINENSNKLGVLEERVTNVRRDIQRIEGRVEGIEKDIDKITGNIARMEVDVERIEEKLQPKHSYKEGDVLPKTVVRALGNQLARKGAPPWQPRSLLGGLEATHDRETGSTKETQDRQPPDAGRPAPTGEGHVRRGR